VAGQLAAYADANPVRLLRGGALHRLITGLLTYCYTHLLGTVVSALSMSCGGIYSPICNDYPCVSMTLKNRRSNRRLTSDIQSIQDFISNGVILFGSNALLLTSMAA